MRRYTISRKADDTGWEVTNPAGVVLFSATDLQDAADFVQVLCDAME